MNHEKSREAFARIAMHIPGGINTSMRRMEPGIVFTNAMGARIRDIDGNWYLDYHLAFGPLILGHKDPDVENHVEEVRQQMDLIGLGTTEIEGELSDKISNHVPSAEKVLFCNTGSEATFSTIRLARAVTNRKRIIKFQGCYHGWHDYVSMNVSSTPEKIGKYDPLSAGMLEEAVSHTLVLTFNSMEEVEKAISENKGQIAAIIIEPIAHNVGCMPASTEFLKYLREACDREGIILIFDEIITGFRHALGGYQSICKVTPDMTTFGKALGNGYPISGLCGREDLMNRFATAGGDVFFAGTFNAHPYSCAAALTTISKLEDGTIYERLYKFGNIMAKGIDGSARDAGIQTYTAHFGSVFVTYFMEGQISNYNDLLRNNGELFVRYKQRMIERGIIMLPVNLKRNYISAAHTEGDIKETIEKSHQVFESLKQSVIAK